MSTELNAPGSGLMPHLALSSTTTTIVQAFRRQVSISPSKTAFRFLEYNPVERVVAHSFAEVDKRALRVASRLREAGATGERVLLIAEPGHDFIASLFGCLYAGAVAVPAYPPDAFRLGQTLPRLLTMIENSRSRFMIATDLDSHPLRDRFADHAWDAAAIVAPRPDGVVFEPISHDPRTLALLQYTSGSTGTPRGVMISHGNLLANIEAIHHLADVDNGKFLHWLPPYHDMGLIGGIFGPAVSWTRNDVHVTLFVHAGTKALAPSDS